jgi:hypothetical protein
MRNQESGKSEAGPGRSLKRSQAVPFVAKEICQSRHYTSLSVLLV